MTRFRLKAALMAAAASLAVACASGQPLTQDDPFTEPREEDVFLTVRNNDVRPATIYAYWNGVRERVGQVPGSGTQTFEMRWKHEEVRIGYELLGRRALATGTDYVDGNLTEVIEVWGGDHLNLVIQPQG